MKKNYGLMNYGFAKWFQLIWAKPAVTGAS
jgi:hypothetical protein